MSSGCTSTHQSGPRCSASMRRRRSRSLDRTQPSLPIKPGRAGTMTHDYKRHGTTDLFAALSVATGEVLHDCRKAHTGADVLAFFKLIDLHVPRDLESLNARFPKAVRRRGHFPNEQAALKVLYLVATERRPNRSNPRRKDQRLEDPSSTP